MIKSKRLIDRLIVFCVFVLLVYHTCTFLQIYYKFTVTVALFLLIAILSLFRSKGKIKIRSFDVLTLTVAAIALFLVGVLLKNKEIEYMIGAYFPYIMWSVIYSITEFLLDENLKRKFLILYMLVFVASVVATLTTVVFDHNAARLLAGAATTSERYIYYRQGVGGYGFVYGSTFLLFGIVLWREKEKSRAIQILLLAIIILTAVMIVFASYTMALLMMLMLFGLMFYARTESALSGTVAFVMSLLVMFFFAEPVLNLVHGFADAMELEYIANRTGQLLNADIIGGGEQLKRVGLYKISLNSFLENMLVGGTKLGGHSMVFDSLGNYGLFGGAFCLSYFRRLNTLRRAAPRKEGLVYVLIIVLMIFNTSDTIMLLPMVMFLLPTVLSLRTIG